MPFNCEIKRDGKVVKPYIWDGTGLNIFLTVAYADHCPDVHVNDDFTFGGAAAHHRPVDFSMAPVYALGGCPLMEEGRQVLKNDYMFIRSDHYGSEVQVELKKGDVLRAWRSFG